MRYVYNLIMRSVLIITILLNGIFQAYSQQDSVMSEIQSYHDKLNSEFADPKESPLTEEDRQKFTALDFFPIDLKFRVEAKFIRTPNQKPFKMATTTARLPVYEKYGEIHFMIDSQQFMLEVYQNHQLRETEEYKDYLFLPFTDLTNGEESYGGGRYLEMSIPAGDSIIVDFNKAYNPYCAYNKKYSCPLVPRQNRVKTRILAGVKAYKHP